MMFNYLFPIFCFGLVMTGIVFLGILEAAKQVKAESSKEHEPHTPNGESQANWTPSGAIRCRHHGIRFIRHTFAH